MQFFQFQSCDLLEISDQIRHFWQKTKLTELDTRLRFFVASLVEGKRTKKFLYGEISVNNSL